MWGGEALEHERDAREDGGAAGERVGRGGDVKAVAKVDCAPGEDGGQDGVFDAVGVADGDGGEDAVIGGERRGGGDVAGDGVDGGGLAAGDFWEAGGAGGLEEKGLGNLGCGMWDVGCR